MKKLKVYNVCVHGCEGEDQDYYSHIGIYVSLKEAKEAIVNDYNDKVHIDFSPDDYENEEDYLQELEDCGGITLEDLEDVDVSDLPIDLGYDDCMYFYEIDEDEINIE